MRSKHIGNANEKLLDTLCKIEGIYSLAIPDGCKRLSFNKIIPIKSPFDRVLVKNNRVVFCDYKHCEGNSFPFSKINERQKSKLLELENFHMITGYLIYFSKHDSIRFYNASQLNNLKERQSLSVEQGFNLGSMRKSNISLLFS